MTAQSASGSEIIDGLRAGPSARITAVKLTSREYNRSWTEVRNRGRLDQREADSELMP